MFRGDAKPYPGGEGRVKRAVGPYAEQLAPRETLLPHQLLSSVRFTQLRETVCGGCSPRHQAAAPCAGPPAHDTPCSATRRSPRVRIAGRRDRPDRTRRATPRRFLWCPPCDRGSQNARRYLGWKLRGSISGPRPGLQGRSAGSSRTRTIQRARKRTLPPTPRRRRSGAAALPC